MKFKLHANLIPSFHAPPETDVVRISGSVQRDRAPAAAFDVSIPAGETSKIVLADGTVVEFSVAATLGDRAGPRRDE